MGKMERREQIRKVCGTDGPEYYHELVNPYFISFSKHVRLCPMCHSKTYIEPTSSCPNLAMEFCSNESCWWQHGLIAPKSMMVPDGYGLPGNVPPPRTAPGLPADYEGPSPMQMVIRHAAAVAAEERARYGTPGGDPELDELERIESEGERPYRKKAQVLKFRPRM